MTVRQMLEDGGWSFEAETNESGEGVFSINSDGFTIQRWLNETATASSSLLR